MKRSPSASPGHELPSRKSRQQASQANRNKTNRDSWRVLDLIQWGRRYFDQNNISNARLEVEWLLAHHLGLQRVDLYVQHDRPLSPAELAGFKQMIQRRVAGEPFQYIVGKAPFYGHDFKVSPAVLIPRPESEILIQVLRLGPEPATILDIGTGSGCLAITAALIYPSARVVAADISPDALKVALDNARSLGAANVTIREFDILTQTPGESFDVVLCNPPYVPDNEVPSLQREIREHEPPSAITDHADGLTFHRRLAALGPELLNTGGRLIVEIGGTPQAGAVRTIFELEGANVTLHKDLQGMLRVCEAWWKPQRGA